MLALLVALLAGCGGGGTVHPDAGEPPDAGITVDAGTAIGPAIRVLPGTLGFGDVAMFPGAKAPTTLSLAVLNAGTGGDEAKLFIDHWEVRAVSDGTVASELRVTAPPEWDPSAGLAPRAGSNLLMLSVELTSASFGAKEWELTLYSNDPAHPALPVRISAHVVPAPDCELKTSPLTFQFGLVAPPDFRDVPVSITNAGTHPVQRCRVTQVHLASDTSPDLSLPGGPIAERILEPGETLGFLLRISNLSQGAEGVVGALEFDVNSTSAPHVRLPISLQVSEPAGCLVVAPDELDFGALNTGCSSATRTFAAYNVCADPIRITSYRMADSAGQSAGGPDCPGTAACPEFFLIASPAMPSSGLEVQPGTPLHFQVKYKPIDLGQDTGAVAISWESALQKTETVVALHGKGDVVGESVDVFLQEAPPSIDVLLVLDDSPSMANEQASVASNLTSFLQYLKSTPFDFHVGVIRADAAAGAALLTGTAHPDAYLTRSSGNLDAQFAAKINVGTSGSGSPRCLEQSVSALTSPLSTGANAGFVRPNAILTVLCVTDTTDNSPLSVSTYVSTLKSLKSYPSAVELNAAGGFSAACPGDTGRLADAVAQMNGVTADLCTPAWHTALEYYGFLAWGFRTRFYLTGVPDLSRGPITVAVDGQSIAPQDASGLPVWTYDPVGVFVEFAPGHVPAPGSTIEIRYKSACYPP